MNYELCINKKMKSWRAYQHGVAQCSLWSQTFAHLELYYCLSSLGMEPFLLYLMIRNYQFLIIQPVKYCRKELYEFYSVNKVETKYYIEIGKFLFGQSIY